MKLYGYLCTFCIKSLVLYYKLNILILLSSKHCLSVLRHPFKESK